MAHVPAKHVEPSHAVQSEIEASVYVVPHAVPAQVVAPSVHWSVWVLASASSQAAVPHPAVASHESAPLPLEQAVHVGGAPAAKVWKPAAHVPAEQVEPSHAVQTEIEVSVYNV